MSRLEIRSTDWDSASDKPGAVVFYDGPTPHWTKVDDWDCTVWRCPTCGNVVPAGLIPFPHLGCKPGTVLHAEFSWNQRLQRVREAISEIARM